MPGREILNHGRAIASRFDMGKRRTISNFSLSGFMGLTLLVGVEAAISPPEISKGSFNPVSAGCFKNLEPYIYIQLIPPAATDDLPQESNEIHITYTGTEAITPQTTVIYSAPLASSIAPETKLISEGDASMTYELSPQEVYCPNPIQLKFFQFMLPASIPSGQYSLSVSPGGTKAESAFFSYLVSNLKVITNITLTGNGLGGDDSALSSPPSFQSQSSESSANSKPFGCFINLTGEHKTFPGLLFFLFLSILAVFFRARNLKQREEL